MAEEKTGSAHSQGDGADEDWSVDSGSEREPDEDASEDWRTDQDDPRAEGDEEPDEDWSDQSIRSERDEGSDEDWSAQSIRSERDEGSDEDEDRDEEPEEDRNDQSIRSERDEGSDEDEDRDQESQRSEDEDRDEESQRSEGENGDPADTESNGRSGIDKNVSAPSLGPNTVIEREPPQERLARHEQSDVDARGKDKRRAVVGQSYGPSAKRQLVLYGIFLAVVVALVIGGKILIDTLDQPPDTNANAAPWGQPGAPQHAPRPLQ